MKAVSSMNTHQQKTVSNTFVKKQKSNSVDRNVMKPSSSSSVYTNHQKSNTMKGASSARNENQTPLYNPIKDYSPKNKYGLLKIYKRLCIYI